MSNANLESEDQRLLQSNPGNQTSTQETDTINMPNNLSMKCKVTCVVIAIMLVAVTAYLSPLAVLLLPVIFLPTMYAFWFHQSAPVDSHWGSSERMFWVYLATAIPGMPIMSALQAALSIPIVSLVFGKEQEFLWHELENVKGERDIVDADHRAKRAAFVARPSYWFIIFYMSFVVAAGLEELLKYTMVRIGKRHQQSIHKAEYLWYGIMVGLSFATFESLGFLIQAYQVETIGRLILSIFERMALGVPIHTICATLTAAGLAKQDLFGSKLGFVRVIWPSVFYHGLFDFVLFGYCAWVGHIGWIHPEHVGGIVFLFICTTVVIVMAGFSLRKRLSDIEVKL